MPINSNFIFNLANELIEKSKNVLCLKDALLIAVQMERNEILCSAFGIGIEERTHLEQLNWHLENISEQLNSTNIAQAIKN